MGSVNKSPIPFEFTVIGDIVTTPHPSPVAMILAAGRGERMRPLTDHTPKSLLLVRGKPLIVWHIEALARRGLTTIVINHAYLGEQLLATLGDGSALGVTIRYSAEPAGALETAGGIAQALPLIATLGQATWPLLVINADIFCDWDPAAAIPLAAELNASTALAVLWLVDNPSHNRQGDFRLSAKPVWPGHASPKRLNNLSDVDAGSALTFSGISLIKPALFADLTRGEPAKLAPLLHQAAAKGQLAGIHHQGIWSDVGSPERLAALNG